VIDPDRVLALAIACQHLKTGAWRRPQVAEIARGVEVAQFPARHVDQIGRKALRTLTVEDGFGGPVPEAPDHGRYVSFNDTRVKSMYQPMIQPQNACRRAPKLAHPSARTDVPQHDEECHGIVAAAPRHGSRSRQSACAAAGKGSMIYAR